MLSNPRNRMGVIVWLPCVAVLGLVPMPLSGQGASAREAETKTLGVEALPISGEAQPALAGVEAVMRRFMARRSIPGGVLAVSRRGRLVFERGFGYADLEGRRPVRPDARFRIASLSKPITAVAILQLVQRKKLSLDTSVFELLDVKPFEDRKPDPRLQQITILQLLQHRGGWNRDETFDPMFRNHLVAAEAQRPPPARVEDVMRYMAGRPLQFDPGAYYSYSNFGYSLLGRVIEKVTGGSYEAFVRRSVFAPVGMTETCLGRTRRADRQEREVRYYGQSWRKARDVFHPEAGLSVPWEYGGFYLEAMDAHGAWVATARDLLRFACDFDDPRRSKLLAPEMVATMFARPPGFAGTTRDGKPRPDFYACGWLVNKDRQDHGGSLPGTTAKLMRQDDGTNWVVLFNTRRDRAGGRIRPDDIQDDLRAALAQVEVWPAVDLFAADPAKKR